MKNKINNSFTVLYNNIVDSISTDVTIINGKNNITAKTLWDTGANCSCISEDLVKILNLVPVGKTPIFITRIRFTYWYRYYI